MTDNLTQQPITKMPCVLSPDLFHLETFGELTENRINTIANTAEHSTKPGPRITRSITVRGFKNNCAFAKVFFEMGRPIVPVSYHKLARIINKLWNYPGFLLIGWGQSKNW
ncbi:MAG: hypothetical protein ABIB93_04035 [Chloroflexota bacterium]